MYLLEFEGSIRQVGHCLQTIDQLNSSDALWKAMGKTLWAATHYPLDRRIASAEEVKTAARLLANSAAVEPSANVSSSSDMVRFDLNDEEHVILRNSKEKNGDLSVTAYLMEVRIPWLIFALISKTLKFSASPVTDHRSKASSEDIFA